MQIQHAYRRFARAATAAANGQNYDKAKLYRALMWYAPAGRKAIARLPPCNAAATVALARLLTGRHRAALVLAPQLSGLRQCITGAEFCVSLAMAGVPVKHGRGKVL